MKPLDLADKYEPLSYQDEYAPDSEPTVKVHMPNLFPKVIVEGEECDLYGQADTIPCPPPYPQPYEQKGVNVGAILVILSTIAFWGTVIYFIVR